MKTKLALIAITFTVLAGTLLPVSASAQSRPNLEDRQAKREELRNATIERRCELVTANVNKLTTRYDARHPKHVAHYQKLTENLKKAGERLTGLGYDTSEVKSKLVELDTMVVKLNSMVKQLDVLLEESKTLACGQSEGAYKAKVEESHAQMKLIRDYAQDMRDFVQSEVKPAMQELRSQKGTN